MSLLSDESGTGKRLALGPAWAASHRGSEDLRGSGNTVLRIFLKFFMSSRKKSIPTTNNFVWQIPLHNRNCDARKTRVNIRIYVRSQMYPNLLGQ